MIRFRWIVLTLRYCCSFEFRRNSETIKPEIHSGKSFFDCSDRMCWKTLWFSTNKWGLLKQMQMSVLTKYSKFITAATRFWTIHRSCTSLLIHVQILNFVDIMNRVLPLVYLSYRKTKTSWCFSFADSHRKIFLCSISRKFVFYESLKLRASMLFPSFSDLFCAFLQITNGSSIIQNLFEKVDRIISILNGLGECDIGTFWEYIFAVTSFIIMSTLSLCTLCEWDAVLDCKVPSANVFLIFSSGLMILMHR